MKDNIYLPPENFKVRLDSSSGKALLKRARLGRDENADLSLVDFSDKKEAEKYIKQFTNPTKMHEVIRRGIGLYLYGTHGVGKTYLSAAIVAEYIKRGFSAVKITSTELFTVFHSGSGDNAVQFDEDQTLRERISGVHLLVIDDLGKEKATSNKALVYFANQLGGLLMEVNQNKHQSLIITSNISPLSPENDKSELAYDYGEANWRLLHEMCLPVHIDGKRIRNEIFKQNKSFLLDES